MDQESFPRTMRGCSIEWGRITWPFGQLFCLPTIAGYRIVYRAKNLY